MIAENSDQGALIAQADIDRFYQRVIGPALLEFEPSPDIGGEFSDLDSFLDACAANVYSSIGYEVRRTFALVLAGIFERQLRAWLEPKLKPKPKDFSTTSWTRLFEMAASIATSITNGPWKAELYELHLVANSVRHGNGSSSDQLLKEKPEFWAHLPDPRNNSDIVGSMRIPDGYLLRYSRAAQTFWYHAGASKPPF